MSGFGGLQGGVPRCDPGVCSVHADASCILFVLILLFVFVGTEKKTNFSPGSVWSQTETADLEAGPWTQRGLGSA